MATGGPYDLGIVVFSEEDMSEEELEQIQVYTPNEELKRLKWHPGLRLGYLFGLTDYITCSVADADLVVVDLAEKTYYPTGDVWPISMNFSKDLIVAFVNSREPSDVWWWRL